VAPFKKGPDYIDAGWLASAAGSPCYNLDPFLIGEEHLLASFVEHSGGSGCAVIEGNRGVFDGMDAEGGYSTARVARILKSPVILILDCTKTTRTAAAMVMGVERFEPGLRLGGVVLNQLAGERHESVVRESIERYCKAPVLGALPKLRDVGLPERHMGLTPMQEHAGVEDAVDRTAEAVMKYVDVKRVLDIARSAPTLTPPRAAEAPSAAGGRVKIGVIKDSAFQFYYPENIEELRKRGAETVEFSALREKKLPDMDALYIGGGFPETHAIALAKNVSFRRSLRQAAESGLPVYAECGGLMYLGESLVLGGKKHEMAGVFPVSFALHKRPQAHGYTVVKVTRANPFYKRGTVLRGHEFHYSHITDASGMADAALAFRMQRGTGIAGGRDGLCHRNVLATYTHLHALGSPEWAEGMIRAAARFRGKRA
jgi:cobyrinic acid a,c-diamide synthase